MQPDDPRHGTNAGYLAHRRAGQTPCADCRAEHRRYEKRRRYEFGSGRPRLIDATGSKRRIQALVAIGWTYPAIAAHMGSSADVVRRLVSRYEVVRRDVAEQVNAVYERLSMTPAPRDTTQQKRDAAYAVTVARKHGWVPPLAWDDIDNDAEPTMPADRLATHGRPVEEVLEEFDFLVKHGGESPEVAAQRLGYSLRTVIDNRNRLIRTGRIQRGAA